jgi:uncharacterized membrane protein
MLLIGFIAGIVSVVLLLAAVFDEYEISRVRITNAFFSGLAASTAINCIIRACV